MEYQDFTIDLRSGGSGRFEATVATAPIRETPRDFFSEPVTRRRLRNLHRAFDVPGEEIQRKAPSERRFREVGGLLYSALFQGEIGDLFRRCRAAIPRDGCSGLRLRLRFRMDDARAEYLEALPWEWLWDSRTSDFLAADLCTPVVRDVAASHPRSDLHVVSPLRILVVDAAPRTLKQLELKLEFERMSEALSPLVEAGQVELRPLAKATPEKLREALRKEELHVLHFMGHGGYDSRSGAGAIFLVADDGSEDREDQVDGDMLATLLKGIPSLRLVVLNSCKTARHASRLGAPLNEGVASAVLARAGIPAVVANQCSISDPGAIAFSAAFYGQIAAGWSVDEAITEARLRLKGWTPEWATPVLFLSAPDGKLVDREKVQREHTVRVAHSQPEADPVRLGVRSIVDWGRDMEDRNDPQGVLDLSEYFDGRYIKEKPWWQEKIFPALRTFLRGNIDERRPLLLDFAAHSSIAFAAGWVLEPKSGLDVRVRQRTGIEGEFEWSPKDGRDAEGPLWLDRPDLEIDPEAPDVALALSVSQPDVAEHVREFVRTQSGDIGRTGRIGRIIDAVISPEPGGRSVLGGAHALRLAHSLLPRLRRKLPHERGGRVHFFCACPNALSFYLGQLASSLEGAVLYEFPFRAPGSYGQYQKSIELPPPGEVKGIPKDW